MAEVGQCVDVHTCSEYAALDLVLFQDAMEAKACCDDANAAHLHPCSKGCSSLKYPQAPEISPS